jgi:hypothetical protein
MIVIAIVFGIFTAMCTVASFVGTSTILLAVLGVRASDTARELPELTDD